MARDKETIKYKSDNFVYLDGTIDESDGTAITNASGGTCEARLFDNRKDTKLSADAAGAQAVLACDAVRGAGSSFAVGDTCYVELKDGTYDSIAISSIDAAAKTITLVGNLASLASAGAAVTVILGDPVAMTEYGTPVVSPKVTFDWGWRGTIPDTQAGLKVDQNVRVQIELNGGAGLQLRDRYVTKVEGAS
jgi:hypothetical protein